MIPNCAVIIPAAGSGSRMQSSCPKQYLELAGKPILMHTVSAFHRHRLIRQIVVVVPQERISMTEELLETWKISDRTVVIGGGKRRQDSVKAGLDLLDDSIDIVLVHDGARPLIGDALIADCLAAANMHGAAIAAVPVKDTLKRCRTPGFIEETIDRSNLWQAQTPQAARLDLLRKAFAEEREATDEASLLEACGISVMIVPGAETNIKVTRPEDLIIANRILMEKESINFRVGHGFDAHCLVSGRELVLCGVKIEHSHGLAGHSDADVATHALCDAILGALGKGDIGSHFPDSSPVFKDICSLRLLERVIALMVGEGFTIGNADITIICQLPRLAPYIDTMKTVLSATCHLNRQRINIKATTTEKMGYTGRLEGISSHAVVLLTQKK